jgi:uncharacterized GH25 family protein
VSITLAEIVRTSALALRAAAALLLAAPALAGAHDLWIERDREALVLRYGHAGSPLPLDAARVRSFRCATGVGSPRELRATATASRNELRLAARCEVASAFLDGGFWSLTPDGERNLPRTQAPDAVKAWASRQYAKWVDPRSPAARAPIGEELELVPVTDLAGARDGDRATFRVLLRGVPLAGAAIAAAHRVVGETDRAGEIRLDVRGREVATVSASVRRPIASPEADAEVLEATLTFEVAR